MDSDTPLSPRASSPVADAAELRTLYAQPLDIVRRKQIDRLDDHCRRFIALSPLVCVATVDASGRCDVSPRGDDPGFVVVLGDRELAFPDRKGNNRLDSMGNLLERSGVGLLFLIPGIQDTLRVNGTAVIDRDPALLERMAAYGTTPKVAVRVRVEEAFLHCGRALKRARLWDPDVQVPRSAVPSIARALRDQTAPSADELDLLAGAQETERAEDHERDRLYRS